MHYEVFVNGKQVNPLSLKLPSGRKLKEGELDDFNVKRDRLLAKVEKSRRNFEILLAR